MELEHVVWVLLVLALAGVAVRVARALPDEQPRVTVVVRPVLPRLLQGVAPPDDPGRAAVRHGTTNVAGLRQAA